jgi:phosphoribosylamine---glycine ligase
MNVLLIGSGGREHAMAWKMAQSSLLDKLYITPGNPGTALHGTNVKLDLTDRKKVREFLLQNEVELVVVGPEAPLVDGLHDRIAEDPKLSERVTVIGPKSEGARLEGSKEFAKEFMLRHNIPTAAFRSFGKGQLSDAIAHLDRMKPPYVIKADGLAQGKGVVIAKEKNDAERALKEMLTGSKFGAASERVVIEQFLQGVEVSAFLITDGEHFKMLPCAKDYKRIGDDDTGPNTGGMGAVSPVHFADKDFMQKVHDRIAAPTIRGLRAENIHYQGFLFMGLMSVDGDPYVIEYNVRLGDPETQAVLPRLRSDLLDLFEGIASGTLSERHVDVDDRTCVSVVLASRGYPNDYEKGKPITGIEAVDKAMVFQAGTSQTKTGLVTDGGRVLAVSAYGKDLEHAIVNAYKGMLNINFEGKTGRSDIGHDLVRMRVPKTGATQPA